MYTCVHSRIYQFIYNVTVLATEGAYSLLCAEFLAVTLHISVYVLCLHISYY